MTKNSIIILFLALVSATAVSAQKEVLDTSGEPLRRGVEYFIKPAITDNGGRFTLVSRTEPCPLFVGQEATSAGSGLPVTFDPFFKDNETVIEGIDFKVTFAAATVCVTSTTWKLNGEFISTGLDQPEGSDGNYFHIIGGRGDSKSYFIDWCPNEACDGCTWFRCGGLGVVVENGKRLFVWDSPTPLPVVFERA